MNLSKKMLSALCYLDFGGHGQQQNSKKRFATTVFDVISKVRAH